MDKEIYLLEDHKTICIDMKKGKDGIYKMEGPKTLGYDLYSKSIMEDTRGGFKK